MIEPFNIINSTTTTTNNNNNIIINDRTSTSSVVSSVLLQTILFFLNNTEQNNSRASNTLYHVQIGDISNMTKCYGMYGCFFLDPPWTSESRPVSLFPESPEKIEPNFLFFTSSMKNDSDFLTLDVNDPNSIILAEMDTKLPLFVIAHGYMESGNRDWIRRMTQKLLRYTNCNVIVVDWNKGSAPPYTQAVANIQLIASITAHLLEMLAKETGTLKLNHVHFIGHSLGAHLAGYVGSIVQRDFNLKLGRISGLDPAEPHFSQTPNIVRLDPSDAEFVDVIHTDASTFIRGGLGIVQPVGHIDFYPNGGFNQPGCNGSVLQYMTVEDGSFFKALKKYLGCSHIRSYELFIESIGKLDKCPFLAITCSSYEDFTKGLCFDCSRNFTCLKFGFDSFKDFQSKSFLSEMNAKINTKDQYEDSMIFYSMTSSNAPYCRVHYRVSVKVSSTNESVMHRGEIGKISVTIYSNKTNSRRKQEEFSSLSSSPLFVNDGGYLKPGTIYTSVKPGNYININKGMLKVEFIYQTSIVNPLTWRILTIPKIFLDYVRVDLLETGQSITVCPKNKKSLVSLKPQIMDPDYC